MCGHSTFTTHPRSNPVVRCSWLSRQSNTLKVLRLSLSTITCHLPAQVYPLRLLRALDSLGLGVVRLHFSAQTWTTPLVRGNVPRQESRKSIPNLNSFRSRFCCATKLCWSIMMTECDDSALFPAPSSVLSYSMVRFNPCQKSISSLQ